MFSTRWDENEKYIQESSDNSAANSATKQSACLSEVLFCDLVFPALLVYAGILQDGLEG